MRRLLFPLTLPAAVLVLAGAELPETGPVPEAKPAQATAPSEATAKDSDASSPEQPDTASDKTAPPAEELPGIEAPEPELADLKTCEADLKRLGVVFERQEAIIGENGCGIVAPYSISEIAKDVTISPATSMRCPTALSLARWVSDVVMPATAAFHDDIHLSEIRHGSTYVCRRRNNAATGKMSEHSIGNAIDIMSFSFEGRDPIPVSPRAGDGTMEEAFQRAVRAGACLHFTTVLGPGSDSNHNDHLHLDIIERSSGYRLCQ
ncbi:extensin family protein [Hoeflea sp.]|uniref:extensin-like domain-containing protein n=1 Tax=Hoeflea sp. TaxID=1940281 RepID=UPI003B51E148